MPQNKEIRTSHDFFSAIDNGYNIYVNTYGKLVAYSDALSNERVKESISVNPVFIREAFNSFFESALHDFLQTQYGDALYKFFQRYFETHTYFTLEGSNALKRELRSLTTSIKTEQITKLYKMIPKDHFDVNETEQFFKEVAKIPYYILVRICAIPNLQKDFQQYLPPVGKVTVAECMKVIEYFSQSFQTSEIADAPPSSAHGKWLLQGYNEVTAQKKSQKNEVRAYTEEKNATPIQHSASDVQHIQKEPVEYHSSSNEEAVIQYIPEEHSSEEPIRLQSGEEIYEDNMDTIPSTEEAIELSTQIREERGDDDTIYTHQEHTAEAMNTAIGVQTEEEQSEHDNSNLMLANEEIHFIEQSGADDVVPYEEQMDYPDSTQESFVAEHVEESFEDGVLSDAQDSFVADIDAVGEHSIEDESTIPNDEYMLDDNAHGIEGMQEAEIPYMDHHLLVEQHEDTIPTEQSSDAEEYIHGDIAYSDVLDENEGKEEEPSHDTQESVRFSYDEFTTHIASLESFVINHADDFPEVNALFMNELNTLLAFLAQYHGYAINRQQAKFALVQHATAICVRYEKEKEHLPFTRVLVLLAFALQDIQSLQNNMPIDTAFLQLLYTLSENYSLVLQYQALYIEEYERALVYASLIHTITPTIDIEQFLLHANTISALSIIKEIRQGIYSAHFFSSIAAIPFDDLQHLEEYYNAYYYQMILFQYGEEFKPYIPEGQYNAHVLFTMFSIVERIHSYVFTDEKQMAHCGKGILSILIEAYNIYVGDVRRPFLELFSEIAYSFGE